MDKFKAGNYINQGYYKAFEPTPINRRWIINNPEVLELLGVADRQLGRLDMFSEYVPNIELFISMHITKEAVDSSKIEGTRTRMEDVYIDSSNLRPEQRLDKQEVQNYIDSLFNSIEQLKEIPISTRLIKSAHQLLMQGVRGKNKLPGNYRTSQNWIGGATINDAAFVPPPHTSVPALMNDLEKFIHNKEYQIPHLIKIAIAHYQFETIHPFLDGNGRIGRLLIPLYLSEKDILKQPILYLSNYFERNRQLYYDHLMNTRVKSDLLPWLKFFLVGVIETAKTGIATFDSILKLQKDIDSKLKTLGKRVVHGIKLIEYMYKKPVITITEAIKVLKLSPPPVYRLISELENMGILEEITGNTRNREYMFTEYLSLFM